MQVFASYIGLALHHAKLYDKIKKNEQKYKVVQEVVNYQSAAPQREVQEVIILRKGPRLEIHDSPDFG